MGKKIYRRLGILILLLSAMAIFTGCQPAKVHTQTDIKEDLSGERVITVNIEKSVLNEHYSGTIQQLSEIIQTACPKEMTLSYEDKGSAYELQFVLAFTSIDDYNAKVHKIITGKTYEETDEPWVDFEDTDSFWKKKFYFEEDFTSIELLKWLKETLVKEGIVSQRDSAYIFTSGENYVNYKEKKYSTYEYAYVENKEFVGYKRIEIATVANEDGTYNREIRFVLDSDVYAIYANEIKGVMDQFVPEGATSDWETKEGIEQIFIVSKENMDIEAVNAFMAHYFGGEGTKFTVSEKPSSTAVFTLQKDYNETVDFGRFYDKDMGFGPQVIYCIQSEDGYTLLGNNKTTSAKGTSAISENKSFSVTFQRVFSATNVQVVTKVLGNDEFERTIKIAFDKGLMGSDLFKIEQSINALLGDFDSIQQEVSDAPATPDSGIYETTIPDTGVDALKDLLKIDISAEEVNGVLVYTFIQRGSASDIANSDRCLFGKTGSIFYGTSTKGMRLRNEIGFSQSINLSGLVSQTVIDCPIEYVIVLPGASKTTYCNYAGYEAKGKQVTIHTTLKVLDVSVVAKRMNGWTLGFWFSMLVFLAGVVLVLQKYGFLQKVVVMVQEHIAVTKAQDEEEPSEPMKKQTFAFAPQTLTKKPEAVVKPGATDSVGNEGETVKEEPEEVIEISEENLENLDIEIDL